MKAKVARRIVSGLEQGFRMERLHTLRKVAMTLARPVSIRTQAGDLLYYPKGLKNKYFTCRKYRPWVNTICADRPGLENEYEYVQEVKGQPGTLVLDVSAGKSISSAAKIASTYANYLLARVSFSFNGIDIVARPHSHYTTLTRFYNDEFDRRAEEYRNSDEYSERLAKRKVEVAEKQVKVDALILELPNIILDEAKMMDWAYSLADVADDIEVKLDYAALSQVLQAGGWVANAKTSTGMSELEEAALKEELQHNKTSMAQYIMGQVIACLDMGMPPHPITCKFVGDYRDEYPGENAA